MGLRKKVRRKKGIGINERGKKTDRQDGVKKERRRKSKVR